MTVGKDPHRPEGKAPDDEHNAAMRAAGAPFSHPSAKEQYVRDLEQKERSGQPGTIPAEEPIGGSRPGVPSRVKDAIARRDGLAEDE